MAGEPKLRIEYEPLSDEIFEVKIAGELGLGSVQSLDRVFQTIFDQGAYKIVINLELATYVASAGIGILVGGSKTAHDNGGDFILTGVIPKVKQVFDMVGLHNVVRYAPNVKEAVKLFKKAKA